MATNPFFLGYTEAELLELRDTLQERVLAGSKSFSHEITSGNSSRKNTNPALESVLATLGMVNEALEELRGNDTRVTFADFSGGEA